MTDLAQATTPQVCAARNTDFSDLTFQVQMNILKGSGGGILFRSAGSTAYYFRISQDRRYALFACTGVETSCTITLPSTISSWINNGQNQSNLIAMVVKGNRIELYINQEEGWSDVSQVPPIKITYRKSTKSDKLITLAIQMWLSALGVNVIPDPVDEVTFLKEEGAAKDNNQGIQMWLYSWSADYPDPQNWTTLQFGKDAVGNYMNYGQNNTTDAIQERAIQQQDEGGIIFRSDGLNGRFYYFRVGRDASYDLYLYVDTQGAHAKRLAGGITPAIHTGLNHPNLLAVVARNDTLDLYVNNQNITRVSNKAYSYGQIGVTAASETGLTEVVFSNAKVWAL